MTFSKLRWHKELHGSGLKSSTYHVLMTVFDYTDEHGRNAFPGNDRLAADTGLSLSTVKAALKESVAHGWLHRESRGGRSGSGAHFAAEYVLTTPWDDSTDEFDRSTGGFEMGQRVKSPVLNG